ncbi:hypothetical protein [Bradyrhizobium sp. STM 3566]|uniref:hypothetical protein n=1 Tax=Bradyrhizobium sp. STM 3566 TaxID=578928 RepID=UPI00388D9DDE
MTTVVYTHPEARREVLTSSGEPMSRADAKALGYTIAPYADLVEPSARIAVRHPEHLDLVSLPPFGLVTTAQAAKTMGFVVSQIATVPRAVSRPDPKASWRSAIFTSPEAKERPSATAELVTSRTPENLTVDQARAFLRGLPVETEHTDTTEETMTTNDDPRAARLAEISNSMAAFNKNMGYGASKTPMKATTPANVEPAKLKRLTEIRLAAMEASGRGRTQEAKTLRLALETHDRVGTPLSNVFAQLGIDAAKLLPKT